jgi:hypothetical protein
MVRPIEDYCCGSSDEAYFWAGGKKNAPLPAPGTHGNALSRFVDNWGATSES